MAMTPTTDTTALATRLQELGLLPHQVERHLANVSRLASLRAAPPPLVTATEAEEIIRRLSEGVWARYLVRAVDRPPWGGLAVCEVLHLPFGRARHRATA